MKRNITMLAIAGVLALVSSALAGRSPSPGSNHDHVFGRSTMIYRNVVFVGRETALVSIVGDRSTDLDLYIYDGSGNLVASDTGASDRCFVRFVPRWTGRYTIRVVNHGRACNHYTLRTN